MNNIVRAWREYESSTNQGSADGHLLSRGVAEAIYDWLKCSFSCTIHAVAHCCAPQPFPRAVRGCVCIDADELSMKLLRPSIEFKPQNQPINVKQHAKVRGMRPGAEMATPNCSLLSRRI
ncbi:hypothetical protein FVEG_14758 [Fusarium verticillioides 7600]|uniref:Uncharacterized protein n=1 Tax=Gibberella moniliformis (strain M3125 / FGSC 7600) TaxID=334819 RepID=W7LXP7_GIBM7|nr:hypothetical protein FVEG_14758 [Fusarium verticillioides 7600]EWG37327.1 hypothetical protein FVEG_14758 [Fusarium verticillioides 7600]